MRLLASWACCRGATAEEEDAEEDASAETAGRTVTRRDEDAAALRRARATLIDGRILLEMENVDKWPKARARV